MTQTVAYAIAGSTALIAAWAVPALAMKALAPSLASSSIRLRNYRGREVFTGLGVVWAVWAVSLFVTSTALDAVASQIEVGYGSVEMVLFEGAYTMPLYAVPIILTLGALVFGLLDDLFGSHGDKGFRGHLGALAAGRLTTGGLKLLGIGALSAAYGWRAAEDGAAVTPGTSCGVSLLWWVAATAVIALSANLVNLTDLRPGRALKTYSALAVAAGVPFALAAIERYRPYAADAGFDWSTPDTLVTIACLLAVLLGPVLAVWRLDLGEHGMLGDAGSNVMGAIAGYLLASALPLPWLLAVAAVLLALNAVSERVSFSAVIERVPPLHYLDRLGRSDDGPPADEMARGSG